MMEETRIVAPSASEDERLFVGSALIAGGLERRVERRLRLI